MGSPTPTPPRPGGTRDRGSCAHITHPGLGAGIRITCGLGERQPPDVDRCSPTILQANRSDMPLTCKNMSTARRLTAGPKIFPWQSLAARLSPARHRPAVARASRSARAAPRIPWRRRCPSRRTGASSYTTPLPILAGQRRSPRPKPPPRSPRRHSDDFAWVTPRTFRKGVATAVDHAYHDTHRAARQLGNTVEIAHTHYIDMPETVPGNREVLERWACGKNPDPGASCTRKGEILAGSEQITSNLPTRKPLRPLVRKGFRCRADRI